MANSTKRYGAGLTKQERRDWNRKTDAVLKARTAKPSEAGRRLKAQHDERLLRCGIMATVAALATTEKPGAPDAWMRLVLSSMPAAELRREIAQPDGKSADELCWMKAELSKRSAV